MAEEAQSHVADSEGVLLNAMGRKLQALQPPKPWRLEDEAQSCIIPRVPSLRRESYEPKMFAIGPYHHHRDDPSGLFYPTKPYKWRFLRDLLNRSTGGTFMIKLSSYIAEIKLLELQIRDSYSELIDLTTDELVELMVLDGCFVIEFLIKWSSTEPDPLFVPCWVLPILRTDILMLENQIPFFVLHRLFQLSDLAPLSLIILAVNYLSNGLTASVLPRIQVTGTIHHLLHIHHLCTIPSISRSNMRMHSKQNPLRSDRRSPRALPSASELKAAGIVFRRRDRSKIRGFVDLAFSNGTMEIPRISVEYSTKCQFQNLVAFEQCCPDAGNNLTAYLILMDCLVNGADDVLLLQRHGIIENKLGCDDHAVDFFSEVCDCAYHDYEDHYLVDLFRDVTSYCESRRHKWRAMIMRDYFSTPWSMISLLAAVLLLILAALQTFFAVFAYYRPPPPASGS